MVSARDVDRAAILPQRRGGDVGVVAQLVRHGSQYLWATMGPLHAATTTREELSRERGGGNRGGHDSGRVLGVGRASLWAWRRGFHVQGTTGTARASQGYGRLAGRPGRSRRMGGVGDRESLERAGRERERGGRSVRVGRQRDDSCAERAWTMGVFESVLLTSIQRNAIESLLITTIDRAYTAVAVIA